MKFIIDTNIIFSGIYNLDSNAGKVLFLATEEKIELLAPEFVKEELIGILGKKLRFSKGEINEIISSLPIKWIEQEIYEDEMKPAENLIVHKKDAPVLACALSMGIDIISGDKHFYKIKTKKIKVWKLKKVVERMKR